MVRRGGQVIAFASVWTGAGREELAADPVRFLPNAPDGILCPCSTGSCNGGRPRGTARSTWGSHRQENAEARTIDPVRDVIGVLAFRYGEHFEGCMWYRSAN